MKLNPGLFLLLAIYGLSPNGATAQEVIIFNNPEQAISWLQSKDWWGEVNREQQLAVPRAIITSIGTNWQENSQNLTVATKKEVFYRFLLPLVLHANDMVLDRRERLHTIQNQLDNGDTPELQEVKWLVEIAQVLRIAVSKNQPIDEISLSDLRVYVDRALYKLDIVPPGLALGQAAYESGYGTSRFAAQGNALFGQWTFGGSGLVPEQQRSELGDHRIAAFEWPFDSVRSYFINLNSHPAYEDFRRLRAELRSNGQPLASLVLADGLTRYSERGQEYVDTLKSIIRVNNLTVADDAQFRDEPMSYLIGAEDAADESRIRKEIQIMRETGEIKKLIKRMALD